jgi:hypothetical protein
MGDRFFCFARLKQTALEKSPNSRFGGTLKGTSSIPKSEFKKMATPSLIITNFLQFDSIIMGIGMKCQAIDLKPLQAQFLGSDKPPRTDEEFSEVLKAKIDSAKV